MATPDFVQDLVDLRDSLGALFAEPAKKTLTRAIHDGWRIVLEPRRAECASHIADLVRSEIWEWKVEEEDEKAYRLLPRGWQDARLDLGHLYVAIAGAVAQYLAIRVVWVEQTRFGFLKSPTSAAQIGSEEDFQKRAEAQKKAAGDVQTVYKQALQSILDDYHARQKGLLAAMKTVRTITARMLRSEEDRILAAVAAAQPTGAEKTALEVKVRKLQDARRNLEAFAAYPASQFGGLLDKWLGARNPLLAVAPA